MNKEKILVDGIFSYDIPETAPDFVLGKTAYKIDKFIEFLQTYKQYAVNGFLTVQTLRSKSGKRYCVLDTYEYDKKNTQNASIGYDKFQQVGQQLPSQNNAPAGQNQPVAEELPVIQTQEDVNVEDIPF